MRWYASLLASGLVLALAPMAQAGPGSANHRPAAHRVEGKTVHRAQPVRRVMRPVPGSIVYRVPPRVVRRDRLMWYETPPRVVRHRGPGWYRRPPARAHHRFRR